MGLDGSAIDSDHVENLLRLTPYTINGPGVARFERVAQKAERIRTRAVLAAAFAAEQARKVLPQFELAVRSDL
ncbi:MAG: hypothetical protein LC777_01655, partial [Actinobacteria bacterium]|nr:hypothetical protein [Actinomycetota bacterium]